MTGEQFQSLRAGDKVMFVTKDGLDVEIVTVISSHFTVWRRFNIKVKLSWHQSTCYIDNPSRLR